MTDDLGDVLSYPLDRQECLVCGEPAIAYPWGTHHVDESLDNNHEAIVARPAL